MTEEAQRIAIAESCGWENHPCGNGVSGWIERVGEYELRHFECPDYLHDLNAIHEAEKVLGMDQRTDYIRVLNAGDFGYRRLAFATAAQRAEAFLRTLGKWDAQPEGGASPA